jgi:LSD1 subclass zinc finger protein
MPRTVHCQECRAILNLPAGAQGGKRLKCPRCGTRFVVSEDEASSASTLPGQADAFEPSTFELPKQRARAPADDLPMPVAEGDLREAFDLPLVGGREAERGEVAGGTAADAAGLFQDRGPARRQTTGDARTRARRCNRCGGLVPVGMSICASCGTDQETGARVDLEEDIAPPPPPQVSGPPFHVAIIGGLCGVGGLILLLSSLIQSVRGNSGLERGSWLCLAGVAAFGIFACVDFIRGRSVKLLMFALSLGVVVDLMVLIGLPLYEAYADTSQFITRPIDDPGAADVGIRSEEDRLDSRRIKLGVALLLLYAVLSVYLLSPPVKRHVNLRSVRSNGGW